MFKLAVFLCAIVVASAATLSDSEDQTTSLPKQQCKDAIAKDVVDLRKIFAVFVDARSAEDVKNGLVAQNIVEEMLTNLSALSEAVDQLSDDDFSSLKDSVVKGHSALCPAAIDDKGDKIVGEAFSKLRAGQKEISSQNAPATTDEIATTQSV